MKLVGLIAIVSAGLYSGFDGPMAHIGTIVAVLFLKSIKEISGFFSRKATNGKPSQANQLLAVLYKRSSLVFTATGAAAGVAAAFRSPIAGVAFALEGMIIISAR